VPIRFRHRFIDTFRKHPEPFAGIAGSPLISRIIKVLDRYGLVSIFLPIIFLATVMTMLPDYLFWILVIWVSAYIVISVIRLFKKKSP
jgi:cellulose synthase/poly-beta-1,6-N-acetylglucosamine synthase-like glycosyltransferase